MSRDPLLEFYRKLSPLAIALLPFGGRFSAKLAAGLAGRRNLMTRLEETAAQVRGGVWFHVTSVGEYEQARPVIMALKALPSPPPVMVTHFSPSGYDFAMKRPCADVHDYLPFDHPRHMAALVKLWCPRLLVFVKFDCWPNQVLAADQAGVPIVLLAGSLQPGSARLGRLARPFQRDLFNRFAHIGVCTPDDARRFRDILQVTAPVSVTGDTRVEQVILRFEAARDGTAAAALKQAGGRLLILGSTWPPDEKLWLPVLPRLRADFPDVRVVLAAHEPTAPRLAGLEARLDRLAIGHQRLSAFLAAPAADARVILVDSVGVLAEIYRAGHLAYVGGSFTTGVHNTMEPAVAAMPVMFGPVIGNAEEAGVLVKRDAGFILSRPEKALATASRLLGDEDLRRATGDRARQVVLDQRGATAHSIQVLTPYL